MNPGMTYRPRASRKLGATAMDKTDAHLIHAFGSVEPPPTAAIPIAEAAFPVPEVEMVLGIGDHEPTPQPAPDPTRLPILVRVSDPSWEPGQVADLQISSRIGRVISATGTRATVAALQDDPGVESIEASRPSASFDVVRSAPFIRANLVHTDLGETGDRALIGIIDSGIDVLHEAFRDESGAATRILAVWDQTDRTGASPAGPPGSGPAPAIGLEWVPRGRIHVQDDINGYISTGMVPPPLGRDLIRMHGTHVASIAAGRKTAEFAGGIAPDAAIVVVIPDSQQSEDGTLSHGYSASHLDALAFIKAIANQRRLPVVVNVSQGMNAGAHDGKSTLEIAFNDFCGLGSRKGIVIVKSAGNERNQHVHAKLNLVSGGQDTLTWVAEDRHPGPDAVELWFEPNDELEFRLRHPVNGETPWVTTATPTVRGTFPDGSGYKLMYTRFHRDNGDSQCVVTITAGPGSLIAGGHWSLDVRSPTIVSPEGEVHAWIEKTNDNVRFTIPSPDMTVTIPGTADSVITVGSIDASTPFVVAPYSCFGPTRDGRDKPDLAAPGENVLAAQAGTAAAVYSASGTSMAAPHVTGAVALLMSARAKMADTNAEVEQMNANQIGSLLRHTTQNHGGGWNPGMGFGVLDVAAALNEMPSI
jgi:subtilisin family serine protease